MTAHAYTPEEVQLLALYRAALWKAGLNEPTRWAAVWRAFAGWSPNQQLRWIYWLEQHPDLPVAEIVGKVMKERLRGL